MIGEFDLIAKIAQMFATPDGVTLGIGDDGAVLDPGRFDLVTTDTIVEGVHFDRTWSTPRDIGYKALAANLSDIAAMGGGPGAFFLNLAMRKDEDVTFVEEMLAGMAEAASELVPESFQVSVAGGDLSSTSGPMVITITLMGESSPAGPVLRAGAVPGDRIAVLGSLGLAAAAVAMLSGEVSVEDPERYPACLSAHRRPRARVHEGALLGLYGVPSALIDISDGLLQDLSHVMSASGVGASVETHSLPRHPELVALGEEAGIHTLELMLHGGEDYELLVTVPPARIPKLWELARRHAWDVYDIGEIRSHQEGLRVLGPQGELLEFDKLGFQHFGAS